MESGSRYKLIKAIYATPGPGFSVLWLEGGVFKIVNMKDGIVFVAPENEKLVMISMPVATLSEYFTELK